MIMTAVLAAVVLLLVVMLARNKRAMERAARETERRIKEDLT